MSVELAFVCILMPLLLPPRTAKKTYEDRSDARYWRDGLCRIRLTSSCGSSFEQHQYTSQKHIKNGNSDSNQGVFVAEVLYQSRIIKQRSDSANAQNREVYSDINGNVPRKRPSFCGQSE